MATKANEPKISAMPTKAFFVEMFTRDIPLEQAILDLVDNSVDGANKLKNEKGEALTQRWIKIQFGKSGFTIADNCGGFTKKAAIEYAFRFGRPAKEKGAKGSIGRFGVGMKRALFKFGPHFTVQSATPEESWGVVVDVPTWENNDDDWSFPWKDEFEPKEDISKQKPGTEITVAPLHKSVAETFSTTRFHQQIVHLIKSRHRSFIKDGLSIEVNDERVQSLDLFIVSGSGITPSVWNHVFSEKGADDVTTRVIVGLGDSSPKNAGWYVICNGRIILFADRRDVTGWGTIEENAKTVIPAYHGQYARFRGVVSFDSDDSRRIPWNTMKTDVDQDHDIWRAARAKMIEMMRPIITFLNELDKDVEEYSREKSPLFSVLKSAPKISFESIKKSQAFAAPDRESLDPVERQTKIQFYKNLDDVEYLKEITGLRSGAAIGSKAFDMFYERQR